MSAARKIIKTGLKASFLHGYTRATVKAKKTQWAKGFKNQRVKAKNLFKRKRPSLAGIAFASGIGGGFGGGLAGSLANRRRQK